jgi:glycosyltransferase involved in cell wall biosynthesis
VLRRKPANPRSVVYATTVGTSALSLLRGHLSWMQNMGWYVTLVSTPDEAAHKAAEREGVALHGIPMRRDVSPVRDLLALVQWILHLAKVRPAAVNVGTPKAGLLGGIAAWAVRVPKRVYTVRGLRLEGSRGPFSVLLWTMERLAAAVATDVVAVSPSLAQELLQRRLVSPRKLRLVGSGSSNGVNATAIAARLGEVDRSTVRARYGLPPDAFVVGFVGRIARDKGIDTLVRAFQSDRIHRDCHLLVIGPTEDDDLARQIASLGDRAHVTGWTDDVWGHLSALDVLSLPTLREGFPTVVLEAAAAGVATITTRATGAVDSVVDGVTGMLTDVGDSVGLVVAINELQANPDAGERMGAAARARVVDEFGQERIWMGILEILGDAPMAVRHRLDTRSEDT